ncbi:GlcG/HbpS family heme-binding protein [Paenibacillus sp. UNC451MF]|uniref:GlcG/HbpS family heme-binding protein n=1 Tax=Paenibacillus sp. UNC451MF TaxID=1449063 RepID=UPI00048C0287|nr:heme-binding protein [Paenibacillus sp. UNC451MF]
MSILSLEIAKYLMRIAEQKAKELGINESIAIVDEGGNLLAFQRMDDTKLGSISIAQDKAWTALAMRVPTANLAKAALPNAESYGINTTNHGRIVVLGGGIPIEWNGKFIGGIGVSGSTSANDVIVANAAIQAFEDLPHARIGSYPYA